MKYLPKRTFVPSLQLLGGQMFVSSHNCLFQLSLNERYKPIRRIMKSPNGVWCGVVNDGFTFSVSARQTPSYLRLGENGKIGQVPNTAQKFSFLKNGGYLHSWCGIAVRVTFGVNVTKIDSNGQELLKITDEEQYYPFFQGGIFIVHGRRSLVIIDVLCKRVYRTILNTLDHNHIHEHL